MEENNKNQNKTVCITGAGGGIGRAIAIEMNNAGYNVACADINLNGLNKSDLQSHAVQIGIIPIDNKDQLMKRLVREFNRHAAAYKKPAKKTVNLDVSKDVLDILAEGR